MSQHQDKESLRRELDKVSTKVVGKITSLGDSFGMMMNGVRASTRIMHKNYVRLIKMHYFIIALLLFVIALDLLKFMSIP